MSIKRTMKRYSVEEVIETIERQIEKCKSEALKITDDNGLKIAYKIINAKVGGFRYDDIYDEYSSVFQRLKISQVLDVLDLSDREYTEEERQSEYAILHYTQLLYLFNTIKDLKKDYTAEHIKTSILIDKYKDINKLTNEDLETPELLFELHYAGEGNSYIRIRADLYFFQNVMDWTIEEEDIEVIEV